MLGKRLAGANKTEREPVSEQLHLRRPELRFIVQTKRTQAQTYHTILAGPNHRNTRNFGADLQVPGQRLTTRIAAPATGAILEQTKTVIVASIAVDTVCARNGSAEGATRVSGAAASCNCVAATSTASGARQPARVGRLRGEFSMVAVW